MEQLSIITIKKFKDTVERILHVPGNYRGGILEMAVVVDTSLRAELVSEILPQLLKALKQQGQIFRNVRFNYVTWSKEGAANRVCPMMVSMTESFYEDHKTEEWDKEFSGLIDYLKVFQARAKLIILVTGQDVTELSSEENRKRMQPFLDKKLLVVRPRKEGNYLDLSIYYRDFSS